MVLGKPLTLKMPAAVWVLVACGFTLFPCLAVSCPSGERYCPERDGCVVVSQNCSDGDIKTCVNMTVSCYENGTKHCVNAWNYTCGNISCEWNRTKYCPTQKKCIDKADHCCTEKEEACVDFMEGMNFLRSEKFNSICSLLASNDHNFTANYTKFKYENLVEMEECDNGTYFCPLVLRCIPRNHSCDPDEVYEKSPGDVLNEECGVNETFCGLYKRCIPSTEPCSYRALFNWYKVGNKSVGPFSRPCPANQTFCLLTFGCTEDCDDVMGNKSCNGTMRDKFSNESMSCGMNDSNCKWKLTMENFTNITDPTGSGWLETCKYRKLMQQVQWEKTCECKPLAKKCKKEKKCNKKKLCDIMWEKMESWNMFMNASMWLEDCDVSVNVTEKMRECNSTKDDCEIDKLCKPLREGKYNSSHANQTISVRGCKVVFNETAIKACNISFLSSCKIEDLCPKYRELALNHSKRLFPKIVNGCKVDWKEIEKCNVTFKNDSCEIHTLCKSLMRNYNNRSMINKTVDVDGCKVMFNMSVIETCNIIFPPSCKIEELCPKYRKLALNNTKRSFPKMVEGCKVKWDELEQCNITFMNDSCELRELCKPLRKKIKSMPDKGWSMMNKTTKVEMCNVTLNYTVLEECNITMKKNDSDCKIKQLCKKIFKDFNNSMMNKTIKVEMCNVTLNYTVLEKCNITMKKNDSDCKIKQLCKKIIKDFNSSMMNKTIKVEMCNVTLNYAVLEECNITMKKNDSDCKIKQLCKEIIKEDFNSSMINKTIHVKKCRIKFDKRVLDTCNITVAPANHQPTVDKPRIRIHNIPYNVTTSPNKGKRVEEMLSAAGASDLDKNKLGIAIVQAKNSSIGSWHYKLPGGTWIQIIIDNPEYADNYKGNVKVFALNSSCYLKFQMHRDDILWRNAEAKISASIVFLPWDGTDDSTNGWRNITRPSVRTSAYGKRSVIAEARRFGCDGNLGSRGQNDVCGVCGGNGLSCFGCDNVKYSGAIFDKCGNCTGGTTNVSFNAMVDCAGGCGLSFIDECRVCQSRNFYVNFTDCTGTCHGNATNNTCGYCVGGSSGRHVMYGMDACGVCNGTNTTCQDCDGVPNGGKERDFCGNCLLPADPKFNGECVNLKKIVPNSGPSMGGIKVILRGAGLKNVSTVNCKIVNVDNKNESVIPSPSVKKNGSNFIEFRAPSLKSGIYNVSCAFDSQDIWHIAEETYLVYNKSDIVYTSISPEYTSINSPVKAVITGSGFVNASDVACVTRDGRVFRAKFENSTRVLCSIPSIKNSVRLHLGISFSRADRKIGDNKLNFTIYANAPNPTNARFSNDLRGILVQFDVPTRSKIRTTDCLTFFPPSNVSSFGRRSRCVFLTPVLMLIILRSRPIIVPNETATFRLDSITQRNQMVIKQPAEVYKYLEIGQPTEPVVPTAILFGTDFLGLCARLRLNGELSYGGGGRLLTFIWGVDWADSVDRGSLTANQTANINRTRAYLKSLSDFTGEFRAPNNSIVAVGPQYNFTLRVKNFLGKISNEAAFTVQREDKSIPGLDLGSKRKIVRAALDIILQANVKLSSCLPKDYQPKVLFSWEIQAVGVNLEVSDKSRLNIKKGTLKGGNTYTLTLTASMESDISLSATATIELVVRASPLKAIIKGGNSLVVGEDDTFILDGSRSRDPDLSSESQTYTWLCYKNNVPCFQPDPKNARRKERMVIPSTAKTSINVPQQLDTNSKYKFVLKLTKGKRKSETFIEVYVKSGAPPKVIINPITTAKINPTKILVLESLIDTKKTVDATWSCVQGEEYGFIELNAQGVALTARDRKFIKKSSQDKVVATSALVINKNRLEEGVTYKFILRVVHSDASSFADIEVTTNAAPSQGMLEIEPSSGYVGNTFTFAASEGWEDDADDLPLTFQFGYYVQDSGEVREEFLGTPSEENRLDFDLLPPGDPSKDYNLTVFVIVTDIYGAVATRKANVIVKPIPLDVTAVNKFSGAVEREFESGNFAGGAAKASALFVALSDDNSNGTNVTTEVVRKLKKSFTNKVLSEVETGGVQDRSARLVAQKLLVRMTVNCKPLCDPVRVVRVLFKMVSGEQSSPKRRRRATVTNNYDSIEVKTGEEVSTVLKIAENVITPDDYTNSSLTAKTSFLSTIKAQEPSLCKGLATGGPAEIALSNITVMRAVRDALGLYANVETKYKEISTSESPEYIQQTVTYRLGETLEEQYASWACTSDDTCTGTCIATAQFKDDLLIQHDPADKNITRLSNIASIRLYNPKTLAEIPASSLAKPAVLRFPIDHAEMYENYTKECRTWNEVENEWKMSGCSGYTTLNDSIIECKCSQLGYIAVFLGEQKTQTTPAVTTSPSTTEQAVTIEFAFVANYSQIISNNTTKQTFISHLRPFLAKRLNISQARITNINVRPGSIIVTFTVLPSNNANDRSVNSTVLYFKHLVMTNNVNLTLPGSNVTIRVDPSSFKIITTSPTTVAPPRDADDDDDGLSSAEIAIIVVVCVLVFIAIITGLIYYFLRVRPKRAGKIPPHSSRMQLNEQQQNNNVTEKDSGVFNKPVDTDEKAV
ncbi:uncharacterized protein LOC114532567 [Dendronephthya gigantea]|uniref:uncharacterized protein LOC114532567 n=1 Tax=Dendronephthya gigantea TaxID=151771 RepID=UPI00106A364D|nr:uncharacterized protein LOC114532567 [Dendronephthya gigantea]